MSQTPKSGYPDAAPNVVLSVNGANNRISSANWVYNGNGNTTRMPVVGGGYADMTHDVDNRMVTWTGPASSNPDMYGYLADNKRVWKKTPAGVETYYLYGVGGQKLMTCGIVASPFSLVCTMTHVYFGGKVIRADGAAVVQDRLGSVVARGGDYTAGMFTKRDYFPYGDEIGTASAGNVDKFGTYMRDQTTGLDYADQRYFASLSGRFLTADPYEASGGASEPGSWNRYPYVGGDPVNSNDRKGLYAEEPDIANVGGFSLSVGWGDPFEGLGSNSGMNGPMRPRTLACLGGTCIRTDDSCEINGQAFAPGALECGGLALAFAAAAPKKKGPPTDPCPAYMRNFFSYLPLFESMASQMNTNVDFILALSARETGYLQSSASRPVPGASNLFGASNAQEVPLGYANYAQSASAWVRRWGADVEGVSDAAEFFNNLVSDGYNSHRGYADELIKQVGDTRKWKALCQASRPK